MPINMGYFVRESVQNFRRNWVMSLGAVTTIYLSLLLVGVSVATGMLVSDVVKSVEGKVTIQVFLKDGAAVQDTQALQQSLLADPLVKGVDYTTKEEALERFKKDMKSSPEIIEQLEGNPLPASLDVTLKDPRTVESMVAKIKGDALFLKVCERPDDPEESLKYGQQVVKKLFAFTQVVRVIEIVFVAMLAGVSLIFISNTIRLAIHARRKEIAIMRLVGASNWFIRMPFLLEGLIQSVIGAVLAILTVGGLQAVFLPGIQETLPFLPVQFSGGDFAQVAIVLVLSSVIIGMVGSGFALRRYLKV